MLWDTNNIGNPCHCARVGTNVPTVLTIIVSGIGGEEEINGDRHNVVSFKHVNHARDGHGWGGGTMTIHPLLEDNVEYKRLPHSRQRFCHFGLGGQLEGRMSCSSWRGREGCVMWVVLNFSFLGSPMFGFGGYDTCNKIVFSPVFLLQ
jgi:hypothetical protein